MHSSIGRCGGEVDRRVGRPSDLEDVVAVPLERVKLQSEFSGVPQRDGLESDHDMRV